MKVSKCPKTVSGKHYWDDWETYVSGYTSIGGKLLNTRKSIYPHCRYCEIIDDTKKDE